MTDTAYSIHAQIPTPEEYVRLREVAGLSAFSREAVEAGLKGTVFAALALHQNSVVGMGRLIGDGGCFFQIVDVAVEPAHQGRGLGKAIMSALMAHVDAELPSTAYVSLIADVPANKLYERFGFGETVPRSLGMAYRAK